MDTGAATKQQFEPSDARFSMRGILAAMAAAAILAAVAGAFLRRHPPEIQSKLLFHWAIWLVATLLTFAFQAARRVRSEKQAGPTLLRLSIRRVSSGHVVAWFVATVLLLLMTSWMVVFATPGPTFLDLALSYGMPIFYSIMATAYLLRLLLWNNHVRFCEFGVLWDQQFAPWDHLTDQKISEGDEPKLELSGVDINGNEFSATVPLEARNRAAALEILQSKRPLAKFPRNEIWSKGVGHIPLSALLRTKQLRWHLWTVSLAVVTALAMFYLLVLRTSGTAEFDQAVTIGVFGYVIFAGGKSRLMGRHAGAPLARVFGRGDIWGFVVPLSLAIALYRVATHIVWSSAPLLYAAGFACCYLTFRAVTHYFFTQLDFRENGIVLQGVFLWPWDHTRVVSWDAQVGRLVLGRRWRRVVAFVPPEQRDAVEIMLREKLLEPKDAVGPEESVAVPI
jgi:hypothetical protein